ncbi:MAG: cytochrome c oxidase accessory protein CcoG [Saprospiraceae bacterium]|nr:cytochrome c oxidase accessory protein CcoG [Saprospiraceae bacterium]HRK84009.1 cytochrome c oxidase accessory protein CcoG [Saprospiraceae bacterium]
MDPIEAIYDTEEYRDRIATVDEQGKRVWIYPKKPKGRFTNMRTVLSWVLLVFLFGMPFVKFNGEPFLLFNVLERKFILFGIVFMPQDFHLFGLAMLTLVVFIVLFTVVFGRLFCGWVCPQTIFMEMVFRKIEYWIEGDAAAQRKLKAAPWTSEKIIKKTAKQVIFFLIAILVSNTFLAYIIGVDEVIKIATEPVSQHLGGFIAMVLFSFAFYFVFSYLREQVCVAICPYGRLQGVLLDRNSIVITYDHVRGEPRGKIRKEKKTAGSPVSDIAASVTEAAAEAKPLGDCIDCKLCIHVCPTGIDIRNGTQLECVNCTACIDACDEVMDKVNRPRGLIRYDSHNGIVEQRRRIFTPRVIAYTVFLSLLLVLNFAFLSGRTEVETIILRTPGLMYQKVDELHISNLYNYEVINKTSNDLPVELRSITEGAEIKLVGKAPIVKAGDVGKGGMFIIMEKSKTNGRKNSVVIEVISNGKVVDKVKTNFFAPPK